MTIEELRKRLADGVTGTAAVRFFSAVSVRRVALSAASEHSFADGLEGYFELPAEGVASVSGLELVHPEARAEMVAELRRRWEGLRQVWWLPPELHDLGLPFAARLDLDEHLLLTSIPEFPVLRQSAGQDLQRAGRYEEAEAEYRRGGDGLGLAGLLASLGRYSEAELTYRAAAVGEKDPGKRGNAFGELGTLLASAGRREEAAACYRASLASLAKAEAAELNRGVTHSALGDLMTAVANFKGAEAQYGLALAALDGARATPGLALLNRGNALHGLANLMALTGRKDEAVETYRLADGCYERSSSIDTLGLLNRATNLLCMGDLLAGSARAAEALAAYEQAKAVLAVAGAGGLTLYKRTVAYRRLAIS